MNDFYNVIAYNTLGEVQEVEATGDNWEAVEICLAMSEQFGYAETLDLWGRHSGDYGDRPAALGERTY
jgi:hypothetical protein